MSMDLIFAAAVVFSPVVLLCGLMVTLASATLEGPASCGRWEDEAEDSWRL